MNFGVSKESVAQKPKENLKTKEELMRYGKEILDEAFDYFEFEDKASEMKWSRVGPTGRDGLLELFKNITTRVLGALELNGPKIKEGYSEEEIYYILSGMARVMGWEVLSKKYAELIDQNGIKQFVDVFGVALDALQGKLKMAVHVRRNLENLHKINKDDKIFILSAGSQELRGTERKIRSHTGEVLDVVDIGEPAARNMNKVSREEMKVNYLGEKALGVDQLRAPMENFGKSVKSGELVRNPDGSPREYRFFVQIIKDENKVQNVTAVYKYDEKQQLRFSEVVF